MSRQKPILQEQIIGHNWRKGLIKHLDIQTILQKGCATIKQQPRKAAQERDHKNKSESHYRSERKQFYCKEQQASDNQYHIARIRQQVTSNRQKVSNEKYHITHEVHLIYKYNFFSHKYQNQKIIDSKFYVKVLYFNYSIWTISDITI